jgi:hypothetical protein
MNRTCQKTATSTSPLKGTNVLENNTTSNAGIAAKAVAGIVLMDMIKKPIANNKF